MSGFTDTSYRVLLPPDVEPQQYDLTLEPDLERFTFDGVVKIACDVCIATDKIVTHAKELLISSATFTPSEGAAMPASEITVRVKDMTATMGFDEVLPVGKGTLEITFRGVLNDQLAGFYRSQYVDSKGVKRHMATTQFEAIDARRCFPCWDEPDRKAVFVVTLVYPADLTALSNMPSSRCEIRKDGRRSESFMPTPKMSTYLLAFCIGEFEFISGQTKGGTLAKIYCCPGNIPRCSYALKCCMRALDFYNDFFGRPYPLPKMDMIAIPDFAAGAMENWGLVTYREVALLCDEATVSATQKQRICTVITHELAHQWFGNLVTMEWWDDLWLNEGFASFMQTWARDKLYPDWQMWEQFTITEAESALMLDSLKSSHPIQVPIRHAEEVEEVFDLISYNKGSCVVRMIYCMLGPELFREGLTLYFQRHAYGNTVTTDLWAAWEKVSGKPIEKIMACWTLQMGFPIVTVVNCRRGSNSKEAVLTLKQDWFLADGGEVKEDEKKVWSIPLFIGKKDAKDAELVIMDTQETEVKVSLINGQDDWITINYGQYSLFRTAYSSDMIVKLLKAVSSRDPSLPAENRAAMISDAYAQVKAGKIDVVDVIHLVHASSQDMSYIVWHKISQVLNCLDDFFQEFPPTVYRKFQQRESVRMGSKSTDGTHLRMMVTLEN